MDRRRYLATSAVIAGASLSGCTQLSGITSLGEPSEEQDGRQLHLVYEHDHEEIVTITFTHSPDRPAIRRLHTGIDHPDDTALDDAQFRFTPETTGPDAIEIYLMPPPKGWFTEFEIYRENDGAGIEVHELGDAEFGDIGFHLLLHGELDGDGNLPPLRVEHELRLSEDGLFGESFAARGETTFDLDQL